MKKTESAIQKAVISWCRQRPLFAMAFHVNNEGRKTIGQAVQDKRMGTLPGIPDICIPLPQGRVLWLELKTKNGTLSTAQKAMHREMREYGQEVLTAYGYEQAIEMLGQIDGKYATLECPCCGSIITATNRQTRPCPSCERMRCDFCDAGSGSECGDCENSDD